jgi:hypothetical protein
VTISDPLNVRPVSDISWEDEIGNVDLRFQWDTDNGFGGSQNEIVSLEYENATAGSYDLAFDGTVSGTIQWDDDAASIEATLEAMANIHGVTVSGSGTVADPFLIEFVDPINGGRNVPDMTVNSDSLTDDTVTLAIDTQGSAGPPVDILTLNDSSNSHGQAPDQDLGLTGPWFWRVAVVDRDDGAGDWSSAQTLNYYDPIDDDRFLSLLANVGVGFDYAEGSPNHGDSPNYRFFVWNDGTGGTFTLTHDSNVTATIDHDASASGVGSVQEALEDLASISSVRVRKVAIGAGIRGWDVEFLNPGNSDETVTVQDAGITGDTIGGLGVLQPGDAWGTGGTVGPDGDPIEFDRFLNLLGNVGVGFHTTDEPATGWGTGGTEGPDGDIRDDFDRFLYQLAKVDTTQPCPFIFSLSASVVNAGDGLTVFGQGFGDNVSPDFGAEVRLYEAPSFAAPFILLTEVLVTDGELEDTFAVVVPTSVTTSGYVAVVHTTTPTCDGSNFIFLTVLPAALDPDAGWWIEAWTEDGTQKVIDSVDIISASFQPILNGVGGGKIEVAADYPRLDEIIIPDPRDSNGDPLPPYNSLLRVFLHGVEQYAFYAEGIDEQLTDAAATTITISGDGIESSLRWGIVLPANHPSGQDTPLLDHLYGSTNNLLANGNLEDGASRLGNLGFELGDVDPWTPEPLGGAIVADNVTFRSGAWGAKISPSVLNGGAGVDLSVTPGDRIFFRSYCAETGGTGDEVTLLAYYIDGDDNEVTLGSDAVNLNATWKLGSLEFTVPAEITSIRVAWRFTDANPVHDFYIDDNFEAGDITPWFAKGSATIELSDTESGDGQFSLKVTPTAFGGGARNPFTVNPGQRVSVSIAVTGPVGDGVTLRTIIAGTQVTDSVVLTGAPTFDILTVEGIPGQSEQTLLLEVYTTETSGFAAFYVDVGSIVAGETATSGGSIFLDFLALAQARGILSSFQTDFSATLDSKGESYDESALSTQIRRSSTLLDVAGQMAGFGMDWRVTSQKMIQFFNTLGSDLTVMSNAPVIRNGRGIDGGKVTRQVPRITRVFAEGSDGIWTTKSNPADEAGIEPKEKYLAATSSLNATALDRAATADLEAGNARQSAIRIDLLPESGVLPFFDFIVGDTIYVDLYDESGAQLVTIEQYPDGFRVIGISVELGTEEPHYTVDLNWMVLEEQAARDAALRTMQERQQIGSVSPGAVTGEDTIGGGTLIFPATQDHKHEAVDITDLASMQEGDPAGGDLAGIYPNPVVNGIRGISFSAGAPSDQNVIRYDSGTGKIEWGAVTAVDVEKLVSDGGDDRIVASTEDIIFYKDDGTTEIFRWNESIGRIQFAAGQGKIDFAGGGSILSSIERILSFAADINIEAESSGSSSQSVKLWTDDTSGVSRLRIWIDGSGDIHFYNETTGETMKWDNPASRWTFLGSVGVVLPVKTDAGDPGSPAEGQIYVNTSDNAVRVFAGAAWRDLATW